MRARLEHFDVCFAQLRQVSGKPWHVELRHLTGDDDFLLVAIFVGSGRSRLGGGCGLFPGGGCGLFPGGGQLRVLRIGWSSQGKREGGAGKQRAAQGQ